MKSLAKKILNVMQAVEKIGKDGRNDFHKYNYASDEAIVTKLRGEMIKNGLILTPHQKSCVKEGDVTTIEVEYTLRDADSNEFLISSIFGQGQDRGDKGAYKAATGAEKYWLLKTFLIPTSDDPEATNGQPKTTYKQPEQKAEKKSSVEIQEMVLTPTEVKKLQGKRGFYFKVVDMEGTSLKIFKEDIAKTIKQAVEMGASLKVKYYTDQYGSTITSLITDEENARAV